jgi:hypothetical protein
MDKRTLHSGVQTEDLLAIAAGALGAEYSEFPDCVGTSFLALGDRQM